MSAAQETRAPGIEPDVISLRAMGPDRAFERLYRKHSSDVYRYALAILRDAGDAEDVTQTTFLNALRAIRRGERPHKGKSWLLAIAHNVCRQRFRNAARRPQEVALDEDIADLAVPDESPGAEDLVRALQQLAFTQRSALVMRELEGRSYAEIGEILELPVSAVETLLFRARRALREQLETSITCTEAEGLLSRQLDGRLPRSEAGALRAHLRACAECARLARSERAHRAAWKSLSVIPLPASLSSLFGGGGATVATGIAAKAAVVGAAAVLVGGGAYTGVRIVDAKTATKRPAPSSSAAPAATATSPALKLVKSRPTSHASPVSGTALHGRGVEHNSRSTLHPSHPAAVPVHARVEQGKKIGASEPKARQTPAPPGITTRPALPGHSSIVHGTLPPGSATPANRGTPKTKTSKAHLRQPRTAGPPSRGLHEGKAGKKTVRNSPAPGTVQARKPSLPGQSHGR
jgi:RNA polymerase sigma factor (sigma-70 family)